MNHTHGTDNGPACPACQSCTVWGYTVYGGSEYRGQVQATAQCLGCGVLSEAFEVFDADGNYVSLGAPTIQELKAAHTEHTLNTMVYYTVLVPYSATPTQWHPTENTGPFSVLNRGAFPCWVDAVKWARANLNGNPYSIRKCEAPV